MNKILAIILSILLIEIINDGISVQSELSEVISTDKGLVQGVILETLVKHEKYSSYQGIPYAKPPLGHRRFLPPEEAEPWDGILSTTDSSNSCPQLEDDMSYVGDEDCLYLNVYTPKLEANDTTLRPVMVWIYGGSFDSGSVNTTTYGPDFILEENVVLAAMNYRLGALGFLSLDHVNATGNAGLKDQNLALQWVKNNIKNFGGDPDLVTLFGQSAGSAAVQLHKLSPMSKGLFSRSIAMSGSPLNDWGMSSTEKAVSHAHSLAEKLGITASTDDEILQQLYEIPAEKIVRISKPDVNTANLPFTPTIENPETTSEPFIEECAEKLYEAGNFSQEPHIIGFTNVEIISSVGGLAAFLKIFFEAIDTILNGTGIKSISDFLFLRSLLDTLQDTYMSLIYASVRIGLDLSSDYYFVNGIDQTQQYLATGEGNVYYYRNSFDYPQAIHKADGNQLNGTSHADDIAHVFWVSDRNQTADPDTDIGLQRRREVRMWTNLAKYGNPTPNGTDDSLLNIIWPESNSDGTHLEIDTEYSIGPRPTSYFVLFLRIISKFMDILYPSC